MASYFFSVCPRGWLSSFHGECFKVHSNRLDWNSAKSACEALGSSLAALNSKAKLQEFSQLFPESVTLNNGVYFWIGLRRDPQKEQRWLWVEGSTVVFTSWRTGEPNNVDSNEDCGGVLLPSGLWNDMSCRTRFAHICEINGKYSILHEHIYMQTGKKTVHTRATDEWITDGFTTFWRLLGSQYYWTDPLQHAICFFFTMNRKEKKRQTCLVWPLDCSRICVNLSIFALTNVSFSLLSIFSSLLITLLYSSSQKSFKASTCSKQNTRETFWKLRVYRSNDTRWQLLWEFLPD